MQVKPVKGLKMTAGLNDEGFFIPLFWADENAQITPSLADDFKNTVGYLIILINCVLFFLYRSELQHYFISPHTLTPTDWTRIVFC